MPTNANWDFARIEVGNEFVSGKTTITISDRATACIDFIDAAFILCHSISEKYDIWFLSLLAQQIEWKENTKENSFSIFMMCLMCSMFRASSECIRFAIMNTLRMRAAGHKWQQHENKCHFIPNISIHFYAFRILADRQDPATEIIIIIILLPAPGITHRTHIRDAAS